jgi:transcriptional regulator with XRE-family HTH domain
MGTSISRHPIGSNLGYNTFVPRRWALPTVGERGKAARAPRAMQQAAWARRLGCSVQTLSRREHDAISDPQAARIIGIAEALQGSADYLFGLQDTPNAAPAATLPQALRSRKAGAEAEEAAEGMDTQQCHEALSFLLNRVLWTPIPLADDAGQEPTVPSATHEGLLDLPGLGCVPVSQLNMGERVFDGATLERLLGLEATGEEAHG